MSTNPNYIMSHALFDQLSDVYGFNDHNGNTYMEHITIVRSDLSEDIKEQILLCKTPEEALNIMSENEIEYTHDCVDG